MLDELESLLMEPGLLAAVRREEIPRLLGRIEEFKARLQAVLFTSGQESEYPPEPCTDRLITVEEAAGRLQLTEQYIYGLLKKGEIPPVKQGKYVRIRASDLNAWIEKHIEKPLDNRLYHQYSSGHEGKGTGKDPKVTQSYSGANGGKDRRRVKHRGTMGTGRVADIRTRLQADTADRTDRDKPETEA